MKLSEINIIINRLEDLEQIELLERLYERKKRILNLWAHNLKSTIETTISSYGIGALNEEELEVAQFLVNQKELTL